MTTVKLSDEALLAFLQSHPGIRARLTSIVGAVGNADGDLDEADAAEERLIEELRLLGREALQDWAEKRVEATEHYFGGGSKTTQLSVEHGRLQIPLRERAEDGSVVEWIELEVRS